MPYKDKAKDRQWHKDHMRLKRKLLAGQGDEAEGRRPSMCGVVTPIVTPIEYDADGYPIYDP